MQSYIMYDDCPENPRKFYETLGTMLFTSFRYELGDKRVDSSVIESILADKNNIVLPVYAYIHSGIVLNTTGFSCRFDSGMCGIIYVTKDKVREVYGKKQISPKLRKMVLEALKAEVEIFSNYLAGGSLRLQDNG